MQSHAFFVCLESPLAATQWRHTFLAGLMGSLPVQDMYESPRQQENAAMMTALDGLKRVFEPQDGLLASLRGLGLDVINGSGTMKKQIMKYAMGIA